MGVDQLPAIIEEIQVLRGYVERMSESLLTAQETFESCIMGGIPPNKASLAMFAMMAASSSVPRIARRLSILMDHLDEVDIRPDLYTVTQSLKEE